MATNEQFQEFDGTNVLITGGLGFIGSNLARRLLNLGAQVTLVDSLVPEYGGNRFNIDGIADRVHVNISDVRDAYSLQNHVQGQNFLFNLAGQTSHLDSMTDPFTDLEINCRAQLSILEACRKHNPALRVVFASTRQLYGKPERLPVDETHPLRPVDVNGINKLAAERYHLLYRHAYGIDTRVLRLTNVYGPRMWTCDARHSFLGLWIGRAARGETIQVYRPGSQRRDLLYVDDAVEALRRAAVSRKASGEVINIGSSDAISLTELADRVVALAGEGGVELVDFPVDRGAIDIGDYATDTRKARRLLGWEPQVPLAEGLASAIAFERGTRQAQVGSLA